MEKTGFGCLQLWESSTSFKLFNNKGRVNHLCFSLFRAKWYANLLISINLVFVQNCPIFNLQVLLGVYWSYWLNALDLRVERKVISYSLASRVSHLAAKIPLARAQIAPVVQPGPCKWTQHRHATTPSIWNWSNRTVFYPPQTNNLISSVIIIWDLTCSSSPAH